MKSIRLLLRERKFVAFLIGLLLVVLLVIFFWGTELGRRILTPRGEEVPEARSVRLHTYNMWHFGTTSDSAEVLEQRLEILAKRDNIAFTELMEWPNEVSGWSKLSPQSILAINPNAKIYRLYDLTVKNTWDTDWNDPSDTRRLQTPLTRTVIDANDWWLRDGDGQIVKENEKTWLLDPGKPGFKEALLEGILTRSGDKGFDGFVFDYHGLHYIKRWITDRGLKAPPAYPDNDEWFTKALQPAFDYLFDGLKREGSRIIVNCPGEFGATDWMQDWMRSRIDGAVYEQGAVGWAGEWLPGSWIERRINSITNDPLEVWVGDGGVVDEDPEYDRKKLVSLAMYYIAIPTSQNQSSRSYHHKGTGEVYWDPLWDFYIGEPVAPASKDPEKYFWSRQYSEGIVLLNYESSDSITYVFNGTYYDSSGEPIVGSVTLPAHTGFILFKRQVRGGGSPSPSLSPTLTPTPTVKPTPTPTIKPTPTPTPTSKLSPTPTSTPTPTTEPTTPTPTAAVVTEEPPVEEQTMPEESPPLIPERIAREPSPTFSPTPSPQSPVPDSPDEEETISDEESLSTKIGRFALLPRYTWLIYVGIASFLTLSLFYLWRRRHRQKKAASKNPKKST